MMLGTYENFPERTYKTAHFTFSLSNKRFQQTLIQTFRKANSETFNLENIADPSVPQCSAIFEFGIAEANNFNYLDGDETNKAIRIIQKKPLQLVDFFCAIRYYRMQKEKKTPLKFDYYILRFLFKKNSMSMQIFHERGPRYVSPEDVANFVLNKINETSSRKILTMSKPS
jgi:uncharacterized membrane protein